MSFANQLEMILPALSGDTYAAVMRDLAGFLADTDAPTDAGAKAMGRALAVMRAEARCRADIPQVTA